MRIKRGQLYGKKRSPLLNALLILLCLAGTSFALAWTWHTVLQSDGLGAYGAQHPQPDPTENSDAGPAVQGTVEQTGNYAPQQDREEPVELPVYDGAVPESEKVGNSYFDDAIFLGDSISTGVPLYHVADNAEVIAVTGINPHNILEKECVELDGEMVTMLAAAGAKGEKAKVYVMIGSNGLWLDKAGFVSGYQAFLDELKELYPGAIIYLQSMPPVGENVREHYESVSNELVMEYNEEIYGLAQKNGLYFVNVFEALVGPDGYLPPEASTDGMHLTPEYYARWFEYLKTHTVTVGG